MKLKKNDIFVSEIIDITNLGFGVAKVDGAVVFVSGTVLRADATIRTVTVVPTSVLAMNTRRSLKRKRLDRYSRKAVLTR